MAFRYAYRHNFFNAQYGAHKIAVMGFSGGGVTARLAMAYWDQQRFKTPSDPLYLSNDYGHGPPVSHFATVASPHLGANVPLSLQVIVQDLGGDFDIGSSYESLNSQAARELLGARIGSGCNDVITETCYGNRVPIDDGTVECNDGVTCGNFGNRCVIDFNSHKDTSFEWPTTPHVALVSNGSWSPQSCESLPDSEIERCTDTVGPGPFSLDTELGYLRFVLDQGYFFTLCDRESRISARLSEWDLRPGDNLGGALAGVAIGGIPKEIKDLMIEQNIPYTFSHTDSALACAGMSDDVECRQFNRSEGRADHVASNPGRGPLADQPDVNGFHKSLDYRLAYQVIAFVFDAWAGDRDGWCDPEANLVLAEFNEKMTPLGVPPLTGCLDPVGDCNDGSTRSYPGAPEVCDDLDNDCDGEFDEGFTGKGIPCDNGQLGACYRAGVTACNATRDGVECNAEYVPPGPREICDNGIDDDCDGLLNEGCPGGGGCAKGDCFTESPTGP